MILVWLTFSLFAHLATSSDNGPVGWDSFRKLNQMSELHSGVRTRQFSSFDRTGGNADGGVFPCLRNTDDGRCVIAEWLGPGEITSIWFTRDNGVVSNTGKIVIELDNIEVVSHDLQEVVDGKLGLPFVWPLVGNGDDTQGGVVIKVPMAFKKSMKVTVDQNPIYQHVTFRTFSSAEGIETFNPEVAALDVLKKHQKFGISDPKPEKVDKKMFSQQFIGPQSKKQIFSLTGSGEIRELRLNLPQLVRSPQVIDDGRAFGSDGYSSFFVKIDPNNNGVRISRRLDPKIGHQKADILVNGNLAGQWNSGQALPAGSWSQEAFLIPVNVTKNQRHLNIRNNFVSSDVDFNEFRYDIECLIDNKWIRTDVVELGPDHPGEELSHHYEIFKQTWADRQLFRYPVNTRNVQDSDEILNQASLRITFDGKQTVDAPLGEFFGSGLGMYDHRSMFLTIDATTGWFASWWPMPFGQQVVAEVINLSNQSISNMSVLVSVAEDPQIKNQLQAEKIGYFHATHNQKVNVDGQDYIFLQTSGHGVFYGVTHTMRGVLSRGYLEGDERIYVDGKLSPNLHGTGTEDFYESGWYFRGGRTYNMPMCGNPAHEVQADGCQLDCTGATKLYVADAIHFQSSIVVGIEHGGVDEVPSDYSSVAYWYGHDTVKTKVTDVLNVTDSKSRSDHKYSAQGEYFYSLTSSFEGSGDKINLTYPTTTALNQISFTLGIDSNNNGVRIFRISDHIEAYQNAKVIINGQSAGVWLQPLGNRWHRWLMDDFDVPVELTAGKNNLSINLIPISYDDQQVSWSAVQYQAVSLMK